MSAWAAVAQVAGQTANMLFQHNNPTGLSQGFQKQMYATSLVREDKAIRRRVHDAQRAGIHPLFALGYQGSPGGFTGAGGGASGVSDGLAASGRAVARYINNQSVKERQVTQDAQAAGLVAAQIENLQARSSWTEEQTLASAKARMSQDVWSTGMGRGDQLDPSANVGVGGPEARTFPMGTQRGRELHRRPLTMTSRSSIPEKIEIMGPDGYRYQITNPALGDEVSQLDYMWEATKRNLGKIYSGRELQEKLNAARKRIYRSKRSKRTLGGFRKRASKWRNR